MELCPILINDPNAPVDVATFVRGEKTISLDHIAALAEALGVEIYQLFAFEEWMRAWSKAAPLRR